MIWRFIANVRANAAITSTPNASDRKIVTLHNNIHYLYRIVFERAFPLRDDMGCHDDYSPRAPPLFPRPARCR